MIQGDIENTSVDGTKYGENEFTIDKIEDPEEPKKSLFRDTNKDNIEKNVWTTTSIVCASLLILLYIITLDFISPNADRGSCLLDGCIQFIFMFLIGSCIINFIFFLALIKKHRSFFLAGSFFTILLPCIYYLTLF